jgi:predicted Rossmann fold nucleotide-binding protein DprA/Smf involved in DNA uptake
MPRLTKADTTARIVAALQEKPLTAMQVVLKTRLARQTVLKHLLNLRREGKVTLEEGKYRCLTE